jgi:Transcriptional regulators containing a DNA-binding HTH domain and an aminotransferase domain (MocR family) and their eukaryotic orthologs
MEVETIPIHMDENGMRPDLLAQVLEERSKMKHKKMPKVNI